METPSSVWKPHQACGNPIERGETPINCGETPIERGETSIERGETLVSRVETWGVPKRCRRGAEALPKGGRGVAWEYRSVRDSRNERTRGVGGLDAGSNLF